MGLIGLLWDLHQQNRLDKLERESKDKHVSSEDSAHQIEVLRERLDLADLALLALWELIHEKCGLTMDDLDQKMAEIDLRDGHRDQKFAGHEPTCSQCGRVIPDDKRTCGYCGAARRGTGLGDQACSDAGE